jgi:hypothetical protein
MPAPTVDTTPVPTPTPSPEPTPTTTVHPTPVLTPQSNARSRYCRPYSCTDSDPISSQRPHRLSTQLLYRLIPRLVIQPPHQLSIQRTLSTQLLYDSYPVSRSNGPYYAHAPMDTQSTRISVPICPSGVQQREIHSYNQHYQQQMQVQ